MSALNLLTAEKQTIGQAPYIPSTLGENVSAAFGDMMMRHESMLAPQLMEGQGFNERDNLIKERFGEDPTKMTGLIDAFNADPVHMPAEMKTQLEDRHETALSAMITEGRKTDPERWSGIKTREEIRESVKEISRFARTELEQTQARAGRGTAFIGGLIGGIGGAFTDPINLATLPLGAGAGVGILRAMATEGIINAGVEAAQVPSVMKWQKELGYKYGIGEAAADVATAGVGGAALTGIIRGIGTGMRAVGSKSMEIMSRMSQSRKIPSEAREALKFQSRVAHIDESIPIERSVEREDTIIHRQAVQETQDAVNAYREPDLTGARERFEIEEFPQPKYEFPEVYLEKAQSVKDDLSKIIPVEISNPSSFKKAIGYVPESITQFIKKTGGIQDTGGELKAWDIKLTGLIRKADAKEGSLQGVRTVKNNIDYVREKLFDEGYFPDKATHKEITNDDIFEAIQNDLSGNKIYRAADIEKIQEATQSESLRYLYEQAGINKDMSIEDIARNLYDADIEEIRYDDIIPEKNAIETMTRSSEAAAAPEVKTSFEADFARLVKQNPDMEIVIDGQKLKLRDVLDNFKQDENVLKAIKTCAIG